MAGLRSARALVMVLTASLAGCDAAQALQPDASPSGSTPALFAAPVTYGVDWPVGVAIGDIRLAIADVNGDDEPDVIGISVDIDELGVTPSDGPGVSVMLHAP